MRLDGWSYVPRGYGLAWRAGDAPRWLRLLAATPLLDRFAFPVLVHRRVAWLVPHPHWEDQDREVVPDGWRVEPRAQPAYAPLRPPEPD